MLDQILPAVDPDKIELDYRGGFKNAPHFDISSPRFAVNNNNYLVGILGNPGWKFTDLHVNDMRRTYAPFFSQFMVASIIGVAKPLPMVSSANAVVIDNIVDTLDFPGTMGGSLHHAFMAGLVWMLPGSFLRSALGVTKSLESPALPHFP